MGLELGQKAIGMKKQYVFNAMSRFYGDSLKAITIGLLGLVTSLLLVFTIFVQDSTDGAETHNRDDAAHQARPSNNAATIKASFKRDLAQSPDQALMPVKRTANVIRENNFPLLQRSGSTGTMGSLVPLGSGSGRSLLSNGG
ncbi:hypothetical protein [Shimia sp. MIT1388]|uniref:hypothetical protein n=1 Tax=Shimia sp. MIT1388 TaxID=3096992 RepID=UPI00399B555E